MLNALTMAFTIYRREDIQDYIDMADKVFVVIFTLEAFLKIMAIGWFAYWREAWNKFDFVIVVASIAGLINPSSGSGKKFLILLSVICALWSVI